MQNILFRDNLSAINMIKSGKNLCTDNSRHIDIHYLFAKGRSQSNKKSIAYCSIEHILAYLFTKYLQGALFEKFYKVIMEWKHIDTLQMVPPSNKERVGNVVNIISNNEEIKSSIDTDGEETERKTSYTDIVCD